MRRDWTELNRRDFLAALGAAYGTTAVAVAAPRSRHIDYSGGGEGPAKERFENTLCTMCPGGCGLSVRVVHGCVVGVRGNKSHPINRGGLCSRASALLQDLYNPDRIRQPLRQAGARGSDRWEPIGWDEAVALLADKLGAIRRAGRPHALCAVLGRDRGLTATAWQRFAEAFGSPNLVDAYPDDNLGVLPAVLATHGVRQRLGCDIASAGYVLSFSSEWLSANWSAEQAARAFAEFRRGRPGFRPRWVHIGPRYSLTAAKSDEWLPIRPGTEGILALGIAHVMIREGLYDREFIERHSHGFNDWVDEDGTQHLGFTRMVLQDFPPTRVAEATGVSEGDIFRLGREFGLNRPAVALGFDGSGCATQPTYHRMAIHCLNALAGSIDTPGGVTVFREFSLLQESPELDEVARRGLNMPALDGPTHKRRLADGAVDLLAEAIGKKKPYPTEVLCLVDADPVFSLAEGARFAEALPQALFVAAFSAYHDDSNRYADLIFPIPHGLHRWDFNVAHTLEGHPVVSVAHPVMPPGPGMKDPYEVLHAVASRIGGTVAASLPWSGGKEAVGAACGELFESGKGAAIGSANEPGWAQLLESRGWRAPFAKDLATFKRDVLAGGGWIDPIYFHHEWDRVFRSPPRKFAFNSAYLARSFEALPEPGQSGRPDRRCLPDCAPPAGRSAGRFPMELYVYPLPNLYAVASANLPWLNDIAGAYMFEKWRTWVEIDPEAAHEHGIATGDLVQVQTPRGRMTLPARVYEGLMPGVVVIPFGFGHQAGGRWCKGIGENPAEIVEARTDPLTGRALWSPTPASIEKV